MIIFAVSYSVEYFIQLVTFFFLPFIIKYVEGYESNKHIGATHVSKTTLELLFVLVYTHVSLESLLLETRANVLSCLELSRIQPSAVGER